MIAGLIVLGCVAFWSSFVLSSYLGCLIIREHLTWSASQSSSVPARSP